MTGGLVLVVIAQCDADHSAYTPFWAEACESRSRTPTTTQIISLWPRPMAPPRASTRRQPSDSSFSNDLFFIDPMLGSPLAIYIEKDVQDKDAIAQLIVVSSCLSFGACLLVL